MLDRWHWRVGPFDIRPHKQRISEDSAFLGTMTWSEAKPWARTRDKSVASALFQRRKISHICYKRGDLRIRVKPLSNDIVLWSHFTHTLKPSGSGGGISSFQTLAVTRLHDGPFSIIASYSSAASVAGLHEASSIDACLTKAAQIQFCKVGKSDTLSV